MNEPHRDREVARALGLLSVPEHEAGFWEQLEARLDAADGDVGDAVIRRMPTRWKPQRTLLVATAAALVLVLGTVLLTAERDGAERVDVGNAGQSTDPSTTDVPTTQVPTTVVRAGSAPTQTRSTPDGAVRDWIAALSRGDEQTAAALLGSKSRRYIESLGGNVEGMMRESEEGYGAWGASPDYSTTEVDLGTVDGAATTIVVVTGTWRGEDPGGFRAQAIPAVRVGNGWVVEPMAFDADRGGRLTLESPAPRETGGSELGTLEPNDVIAAAAPGNGDFFFSLEDSDPVRVAGQSAGGGVRATWDPPGEMAEHTHLLVVAYADGDTLTAVAGRFTVSR